MTSGSGIKLNNCINGLKNFFLEEDYPSNLAHDVVESFAIDVMSGIKRVLVEQKHFTLQALNNRISTFEYARIDKANKPQLLKIISSISFKMKKTACEMWNMIRLFPIIIGFQVKEGNKGWECCINFVIQLLISVIQIWLFWNCLKMIFL